MAAADDDPERSGPYNTLDKFKPQDSNSMTMRLTWQHFLTDRSADETALRFLENASESSQV